MDRLLLNRFLELIPEDGLVCDIGCGPGEIADYLYRTHHTVIGIDISGKMIEEAKRLNPEIEWRQGDMFDLDLPDGSFSGICSFYAVVNFQEEEIRKILREYFRVLKREGILFITFHVGEKTIFVDDFFESGKPLLFFYHNENRMIGYLRDTGFEIIEALVRAPYEEEYPSNRAYIMGRKR